MHGTASRGVSSGETGERRVRDWSELKDKIPAVTRTHIDESRLVGLQLCGVEWTHGD